jgi:glycosyltransferase involved in cell wall biosynthesis
MVKVMRVAIACSGLGNVRRGYETFSQSLFNNLKDRINISLFKGGGNAAEREKVLLNIGRDSLFLGGKNSKLSWEKRYLIEQFTFSVPLTLELINHKYDILHFSDTGIGNIIFHLKKISKRFPKLVFSNGGAISPEHYARYDHIQQLTEYQYEIGKKFCIDENKMTLLPYGVDTELFCPGVDPQFRLRFGIPEDSFLVLSVGAVEIYYKRMNWIINEIAGMTSKPFLLIIGDEKAGESEKVKKLGYEKLRFDIKFLKLEHKEIASAYRAADLFVLASLVEGLPNAILEAMASGLPAIVNDHPNLKWIISEGGMAIDMEEKGQLASTISYFMDNKDEAIKFGRKARERAEEVFSWEILIPKYIDMYERLIGEA